MVVPENHRTVCIDKFLNYLNKYERTTKANAKRFSTYMQGASLSIYEWNTLPIDGTDIIS